MSSSAQPENNKNDDARVGALLLCNNFAFPMIFKAAIDLKIFDIITREGPGAQVSASYIASLLPTQDPKAATSRLDRMLRLLVTHSVLTCSMQTLEDGKVECFYGLTLEAQFFAAGENSLASVIALEGHEAAIDAWLHIKDVILGAGSRFEGNHGMNLFEYMEKDPTLSNFFNKAMFEFSNTIMKGVLEVYKGFEGLNSLVDVAGGIGKSLHMVISKYPSIKGINFDLPHVTQTAPSYPGIEHVGGDMFSVIPDADTIMIKETLHNWDDEHCIKVLRKCYEALPNNGKVIVINLIMSKEPNSTTVSKFVSRIDNTMLLVSGGKERTEKEFEALCMQSGFTNFRVVCLAYSLWGVMEFVK